MVVYAEQVFQGRAAVWRWADHHWSMVGSGAVAGPASLWPWWRSIPWGGPWPLWLAVEGLAEEVPTIAVEIHDLSGKRVVAREMPAQHGAIGMDLNGEIATGTYVVTITAGDQRHVELLVIVDRG
jgi:hypothetical protein